MLLTGVRAARRPRNLGGNCRGGRFGFSGGSYRKLYLRIIRVERRFGLRPFVSTTFADYSLEGTLQFLRIDRQHVDRIYFPDIRYCD